VTQATTLITLDLDEIAALYRTSRRQARDVVVKTPGFPMPIPGCGKQGRVWLADDVRRFMSRRSTGRATQPA
jgi:hypothetical protein